MWLWVGTRPRVLWEEPGCGPAAPSGVLRDSKQPLRFRRSMPGRPRPSGPARVRTREIRSWVILSSVGSPHGTGVGCQSGSLNLADVAQGGNGQKPYPVMLKITNGWGIFLEERAYGEIEDGEGVTSLYSSQ